MNSVVYKLAQALRRLGFHFHEKNGPRVKSMREAIRKLDGIQFNIEFFDNGKWVAESTNVDGIMTGGTNRHNINESLKDAVFTYFEIPPQLCNDAFMRASDVPLKLQQKLYA